ncbi:MAG: hypothetical protein MUC42_11445, partial [Bryobacter sp.]|nr:hypothetical protein [Bryobacter sp.]
MKPLQLFLISAVLCAAQSGKPSLLVEAEGFAYPGGWVVDQQFVDQMGSAFLLAHGMGVPVADARTTVDVKTGGTYHVWVRTRDWVAPWKAAGAPGRFQVLIDGKPLAATFGTAGAEWHWQNGGTVRLKPGKLALALHDLTGFAGRCDAILLTQDAALRPPDSGAVLKAFRKKLLGIPEQPAPAAEFDLV